MKNLRCVLAFLFITTSCIVSAQTQQTETVEDTDPVFSSKAAKRKLVVGVKAGFNYSNVYDEQGTDFVADGKNGFAGGAFLAIPVGSLLGLQPEILISQKGFQGSGTLLDQPYDITRTTTYLDI